MRALAIPFQLVANVLPVTNLPMALGNLHIATNGFPLVPIGNNIWVIPHFYKFVAIKRFLKFRWVSASA